MNLIVATCGISLRRMRGWHEAPLSAAKTDELAALEDAARAREFARKHVVEQWWKLPKKQLPAELTTLLAWHEQAEDADTPRRTLLISGKTNFGDALVLAALIDDWHRAAGRNDLAVEVAPYPLDPVGNTGSEEPGTFAWGLRESWLQIKREMQREDVENCHLLLTGGYKGVLMQIAQELGAWVRYVDEQKIIRSYYIHEDQAETQGALVCFRLTEPGRSKVSVSAYNTGF